MPYPGAKMNTELVEVVTVAAGLLDALPDATAVLDQDGCIVAVNRAWEMFALDNGGHPESTGVGVNYLEVCRRSAATGCDDAAGVAFGLEAVLAGDTVESDFDYPCPSPEIGRWFSLRMTPLHRPERGVVIAHTNITRRKMAELDLQRRASHDPLTGLGNRVLLAHHLARALTDRRPNVASAADVGLLYIDLDGFKPINDTYGHAAGDEVLQIVARRLSERCRPQDTIARLGGDEFAVLALRLPSRGLAGLVARIESGLAEPIVIHGQQVTVGASIGSYSATPGELVEDCLQCADKAMYANKRSRVQQRRQLGS